jgi:hypothetical protein
MKVIGGEAPTNPFLVEAMRRVVMKDGARTRKTFFKELLRSTFLVPLSEEAQIRPDGRLDKGQVPMVMGKDAEGYLHMLAFTDVVALNAWGSDARHAAVMPASTLFKAAVENRIETITLNYKQPVSLTISRPDIEALAEGRIRSAK